MARSPFVQQIKAARLTLPDLEWLSNSVLTVGKLRKHSDGTKLLSAADYALLTEIIDQHRAAGKGIRMLVISTVKMKKPKRKSPISGVPVKGQLAPGLAAYVAEREAKKVVGCIAS